MHTPRKVEHLVVDTTGFIKNANLQDLATNVYTVQGVVDEVTNKRQLRRLVVLPYDLKIKDVFPENIKIITDFAKKTGDYPSLSAVDIQVMALTYQLEKGHVGVDHLSSEPHMKKVEKFSEPFSASHMGIAGFYMPPRKNKELEEEQSDGVLTENDSHVNRDAHQEKEKEKEEKDVIIIGDKLQVAACSGNKPLEEISTIDPQSETEVEVVLEKKIPEMEEVHNDEILDVFQEKLLQVEAEEIQTMRDLEEALQKSEITDASEDDLQPWATSKEEYETELKYATDEEVSEEEEEDDDDDIWDDNVWITPENVEEAKRELKGTVEAEGSVKVACITGDFAMQNVIKQLGLNALATDGRIIKELRTYVLRCYSCFKTTSKMEVIFCPHCGNHTLRRAAVLLKPDGTQEVQISFRRPPTGRGKRFSLPKPQGGKHANNPVLCPDQRIPQQFVSRLARTKNDPLEPDYIAGYSPFVTRDVTSRSAMLGIKCNHTEIKNWMRRNPNEVVKKGKKKRR